jgi:CheY-like chemotaxis protein
MKPSRILIVDDDVSVVRVLARVFRNNGYDVTTAAHGGQALEMMRGSGFDALLSDINMPAMSGEELFRSLGSQGLATPRCVLIMTCRTEFEERRWVDEIPGARLVEKPVSPRDLVRMVSEQLAATDDDRPEEKEAA